jgi:PAS domain S-box-containing protein
MGVRTRLDNRYFPLVLDVVSQGIFTINAQGKITSFNRAAEEITGFAKEEVIGRSCDDLFKTDLCDTVCPLKKSISSGARINNREVRIQTKDGRSIPVSISTAPLVTATGKLVGGVEVFRDMSQVEDLKRQLDTRHRLDDIVSKNSAMQKIFELIPLVAESDSTILVTGASGTGKELIAKAIHNHGPRRDYPFVAVNCGAVPETLLESELFGYLRGAFTDARRDKPGRIAQADSGTLFLDEVGDLPRTLQIKLLRFLQERVYEPLGSNRSIRADVRVIAATHRDLEKMAHAGEFREDLYYRLNVMQIHIPPLCERMEDVPLLAAHFIQRFRDRSGKDIRRISGDVLGQLMQYDFPGNVRELENLIERAFILCTGEEIGAECLPQPILSTAAAPTAGLDALEQVERETVRMALRRHDGNRTRAARELGIHRSTLLRKIKRYGL